MDVIVLCVHVVSSFLGSVSPSVLGRPSECVGALYEDHCVLYPRIGVALVLGRPSGCVCELCIRIMCPGVGYVVVCWELLYI